MSDQYTPRPEPQADGLEELPPRAPGAAEQANVKGGLGDTATHEVGHVRAPAPRKLYYDEMNDTFPG